MTLGLMERKRIESAITTARRVYARAVENGTMTENSRIFNLAAFRLLLGDCHAKTFSADAQAALNRAAVTGWIVEKVCNTYRLTAQGRVLVLVLLEAAQDRERYEG